MSKLTDPGMHDCIQACWTCRDICQATLYNYCMEQGGHHAEPAHVRLMADCIQICQTSADFMTRNSELHEAVCAVCAEVCEACGESCSLFDDDQMKACAKACNDCAAICREMSQTRGDRADSERPGARPS